ncbi:MAG: outer membrane lipoprotein-sorting protein, partial [Desulfuromonadales bacterium]|nr:outer membrane lipoprotein-sorting protein [Desulfuromonadales bacterium]
MVKVRDMVFADVKKVDGRILPLRITIQPVDTPEERTILQYSAIDFNIKIGKSFFSLRN